MSLYSALCVVLLACSERELLAVRGVPPDASMADSQLGTEPDASEVSCEPRCSTASDVCISGRCVATAESPTLAVANSANCVLRPGGQLLCWGRNSDGELGVGDNMPRLTPTEVGTRTDWVEVAAGVGQHFCALATNRTDAWCWGLNYAGALGLGDLASRSTPTLVMSVGAEWARVVPDSGHTCLLSTDHGLWCTGRNDDGELGLGDTTSRTTLSRVTAGGPFVTLSAGWGHTCGLIASGSLWCWGFNAQGQLGLGDNQSRSLPSELTGRYSQVTARGRHTCALRDDGSLWCWGSNLDGQLGVGDAVDRSSPTRVQTSARFRQISNGYYHTCAIAVEGSLWCWGSTSSKTIDVADASDVLSPTRLNSDTDWLQVAGGYTHSCALKQDQSVWCWGSNELGQLGQGDALARPNPTRVVLP